MTYTQKNKHNLFANAKRFFSSGMKISPHIRELSGIIKLTGKTDLEKECKRHLESKLNK